MWDYLLFDLDGTLTDSGPGIMNSTRHTFEAFGLRVPEEPVLKSFIGPPLAETLALYFPAAELDRAIGAFREYYEADGWLECEVYPGIRDCLAALRTAGAHLAVATSKSHPAALRVMAHFGLADAFDVVCGSAPDGPATKAGVIRRVLQQLGCPQPGRAVMIGDRKYDILGARAVGLSSVGVLYGYGSREELCAAGAGALAASVSDLQALLLQNLSRS